jgi:hypothetical protein
MCPMYFCNFHKNYPNSHPIGENSPNLVTLSSVCLCLSPSVRVQVEQSLCSTSEGFVSVHVKHGTRDHDPPDKEKTGEKKETKTELRVFPDLNRRRRRFN